MRLPDILRRTEVTYLSSENEKIVYCANVPSVEGVRATQRRVMCYRARQRSDPTQHSTYYCARAVTNPTLVDCMKVELKNRRTSISKRRVNCVVVGCCPLFLPTIVSIPLCTFDGTVNVQYGSRLPVVHVVHDSIECTWAIQCPSYS